MAGRKYKRLRAAGQDAPPFNIQTSQILQWGGCLIAWPTPFPMDQAEAAWEAHRHHVIEEWELYWKPYGILPACWAELRFDGVAQIETKGLDPWLRDRVASIG